MTAGTERHPVERADGADGESRQAMAEEAQP
jgi:hypothetical protein